MTWVSRNKKGHDGMYKRAEDGGFCFVFLGSYIKIATRNSEIF